MTTPDAEGPTTAVGVITALGGILAWLRLRNKDTAEAQQTRENSINEATKLLFDSQSTIISQQNEKILRLEGRIDQISTQMAHLLTENAELRGQVISLQNDNQRLASELERLEKVNEELRVEIATLKGIA